MSFAAMLVAMAFAAAQDAQHSDDPARWRCTHSVEAEQGNLDVIRSLDAEGRPVYDYVLWLPRERMWTRSVRWERQGSLSSATLPWTLRTDLVAVMLNLDRPARRPVWLVLSVDGRPILRRLLFRDMAELPPYDREQLEIWTDFRSEPPEPGRTPDVLPDLTDAAEIVLTAEEEGGDTLARHAIAMPGRALIDRAVAQASPALAAAAADHRRFCRPVAAPAAIEAMPPPG